VRPLIVVLVLCVAGCPQRVPTERAPRTQAVATTRVIVEHVYDGALAPGWKDAGWSPRDVGHGPASIDFSNQGGWMLVKPNLGVRFGGLVFREKPPVGEAEFLEVRLDSHDGTIFPRIKVHADQKADVGDGWEEVFIPMTDLDPDAHPFDRIVFRAFRDMPPARVLLDHVGFVPATGDGGASATGTLIATAHATMRIDCSAHGKSISPLVYGIAWGAHTTLDQLQIGATTRRWGGNATTRYNWELGNAWNTASDWFFENVEVKSASVFLDEDDAHHMLSALTVPMIGWVAKDTTSSSFPVSVFGPQQRTDEYRKDAGNGVGPDGKPIKPGPPTRTSVAAPPDFVGRWLAALRKQGQAKQERRVGIVFLDNEPMLWDSTHRDVHPDPVGYDELLERSVHYATAIRKADPEVRIAGPSVWGWPAYQYSAKDAKAGFRFHPDRTAHGGEALLPWYLAKMRAASQKSGMHLLDLLDVHFYPQGDKVYSPADDPKTAALRIRQTRGLWDRTYVDESWIKEPIYLLPRLHEWIDKSWPGLGIVIGEWSFGGEGHMSGGLATAEALGRFGENGVTAAYYWTVPPANSPSAFAFRAYRDFDGRGGHFEDYSIPASASPDTSIFASRDASGKHLVFVVLNFSHDAVVAADIDASSCGVSNAPDVRTYAGGGAFASGSATVAGGKIQTTLLPYSITVVDVHLTKAVAAAVDR
jgi:hypothetical protein